MRIGSKHHERTLSSSAEGRPRSEADAGNGMEKAVVQAPDIVFRGSICWVLWSQHLPCSQRPSRTIGERREFSLRARVSLVFVDCGEVGLSGGLS